MLSRLRILVIPLVAVMAVGCASATKYVPLDDGEGYSSQRLESNRFIVRFAGNRNTSLDTVQKYLLYRAAEVTLANGDDYFVITDRETLAEYDVYRTYSFGTGLGHWYWYPHHTAVGITDVSTTTEFVAEANIVTYEGEKPKGHPMAYNARELKKNLEDQIVWPEET